MLLVLFSVSLSLVRFQFPAMRNLSLQRGDAFILVYDVTKADTFEAVRRMRDDIHRVRQTTSVPIVVVGNKIDLADVETREVNWWLHQCWPHIAPLSSLHRQCNARILSDRFVFCCYVGWLFYHGIGDNRGLGERFCGVFGQGKWECQAG